MADDAAGSPVVGYYNGLAGLSNQEKRRAARHNHTFFAYFTSFGYALRPAVAEGVGSKSVSFVREVAPIFVRRCQSCHGPKTAESNYRLDTFELLMKPGDFEMSPVTPGDLDNSNIYQLIIEDDADDRMPNNGGRLTDGEIQTIANWIRTGAKFDGHDRVEPLRDQIPPDVPYPAAPATYPATIPITAIAFTPDGTQLIVGGYHELLVWNPKTAKLVARVTNIPQRVFGMEFTADGSLLAIAGGSPSRSGEIRLIPWDGEPKKEAEPKILARTEHVFFDVAFRPDGKKLAAGGADGSIRVFDIPSGVAKLKINNHADWVTDLCFSPDGKRIASASRDKTAKVFDAETGELLTTYSNHKVPVRAVVFAPDGKSVISAGGSGVHIWNADDAKMLGELKGFQNDVYSLSICSNTVVAASADQTVRQFKLADRSLVRSLSQPASALSLASNKTSQRVCAGCFDGVATVWDLKSGAVVKQFLAIPAALKPNK